MQHFPTSHTLFHSILITILSFWCYYCCIFQDEEDEVYREVSEFSQDHPAGSVKSGIKVRTVWIQNLFSKPTSNALCDSLCLQKREKDISSLIFNSFVQFSQILFRVQSTAYPTLFTASCIKNGKNVVIDTQQSLSSPSSKAWHGAHFLFHYNNMFSQQTSIESQSTTFTYMCIFSRK